MEEIKPNNGLFYRTVKRLFDVGSSASALVLLSPVMGAVAVAIKLEDGGPVIYSAPRIGTGMKEIRIHKFRSMYVGADKDLESLRSQNDLKSDIKFKMKNDPRVTKVGKFIRKTSLDELPQLWDVLKGDLSVVGPRPHSPYEVAKYSEYDCQRFKVQAGLMCYTECMGRNNLSVRESLDYDIKYLKERSIATDLKILVKSVIAVLKGEGAE